MPLDHISEVVAHFIGCFNLTEEGARLRETEEPFNWHSDPNPNFNPLNLAAPGALPGYDLDGYDAGLTPFWFSYLMPGVSMPLLSNVMTGNDFHTQGRSADLPQTDMITPGGSGSQFSFELPVAPSQAMISLQLNVMSDNDSLGNHEAYSFQSARDFDQPMAELLARADALSGKFPASLNDVTADPVMAFDDVVNPAQTDHADASVTLVSAEGCYNTIQDGAVVTELPILSDLLPEYMQPDVDTGEVASSCFDAEPGHSTVSGGNYLINETVIVQAAPDAGLILVAGDAISLNAISQANILQNVDVGTDPDTLVDLAVNAATMNQTITSSGESDEEPVFAANWIVTRIDGDLISTNWVQQHNFITDHDTASITWSASDSFILTGGNTGLNQVISVNMAMNYDLIIVGGQMINMNLILQMNVLLDNDTLITGSGQAFTASGGDNLLLNFATIQQTGVDSHQSLSAEYADVIEGLGDGSDAFPADVDFSAAGGGMLNVLYISGDYVTVNSIEQINTLGDADQVGAAFDGMSENAVETDGEITFTTGSNALVNVATIIDSGLDSTVMAGGDVYDDATLYQAELIETTAGDSAPLASEAVAFLMDEPQVVSEDTPLTGPDYHAECPADITQCMIA